MSETPSILALPLKEVSRSFYLTLRVLPARIREQIGLAYLLARTTDTVADTELIPVEQRLQLLQQLRERILGRHQEPLDFGGLARQSSKSEAILLERCEESLAILKRFSREDQTRIREVLEVITSGQELDLRRFAGASAERIVTLAGGEELEDYTWRVAGCVGEFWTRMCRAHLFPKAKLDYQELLVNGVRFGKGLQLVNILRDLPMDLRQGRCYVPQSALTAAGLVPHDLLEPANEPRFRAVYDRYLTMAEGHLAAGWTYTNALPRNCVRVRLACAWPVLIGAKTLARLRAANVLDPRQRIKISRPEVKNLIFRSVLCYPWQPAWRRLFSFSLSGR